MGGQNNWAIDIDANDWMRSLEKRVLHEERRPSVRSASDLLGPGFAPYAVQTTDWSNDVTARQGFWWSAPGALNSPDPAKTWMGGVIVNEDGSGIQEVQEQGPGSPPLHRVRTFRTAGTIRTFSAWGDANNGAAGPVGPYGPPGPPGPPGSVEVYEQPNDPGTTNTGALWIDTDEGPYYPGGGGGSGDDWIENVVLDHGATGNGYDDDTTQLQAAIDTAVANGKRIYFPRGTYITTRSLVIPSGAYLFGATEGGSIIRMLSQISYNVDMMVALNDTGKNITLENLTVDGNLMTQDLHRWITCLHFLNVTNLKVIDCSIIGSTIDGVYLYKCDRPQIIRVNASGNGQWRNDASGMNFDTCTRVLCEGAVADNNGFHGILLSSTTDSIVRDTWARGNGYDGMRMQWSADRNRIERYQSEENFRGLYLMHDSTLNQVDHCFLKDNQTNGLYFYNAYGNVASFNHIEGNGEYAVATVSGTEWNYGWANSYRGNALGQVYLEPGSSFDPAQGAGFGI